MTEKCRWPRNSRCKRYRYEKAGRGEFRAVCLHCEASGLDHSALFNTREPLGIVPAYFLGEAQERNLPCVKVHEGGAIIRTKVKWLKEYWGVRQDAEWKVSKKARGPYAALVDVLGEETASDPVLVLGLEPKPVMRDEFRFEERWEVVPLGPNKKAADETLDRLKNEARVEEHLQRRARRPVGAQILKVVKEQMDEAKKLSSKIGEQFTEMRADGGTLSKAREAIGQSIVYRFLSPIRKKIEDLRKSEDLKDDEIEERVVAEAKKVVSDINKQLCEPDVYRGCGSTATPPEWECYKNSVAALVDFRRDVKNLIGAYGRKIEARVELRHRLDRWRAISAPSTPPSAS